MEQSVMENSKMETKDLMMQFGVFNSKRASKNQKIQYLTRLSHYFNEVGYSMSILKEKHRGKDSYIGVVGDVKKAKYIIATHYDTPMIDFFGKKHDPFNDKLLEKKSIKNLSIALLICLLVIFLVTSFYIVPQFTNNIFNFNDILGGVILVFLVMFTQQIIKNGGFPSRTTLVRNTSSNVALLEFILKYQGRKDEVAFAFVDYGNMDYFGYHVLKSHLGDIKIPIYILDSVGNSDIVIESEKSQILKGIFENVTFIYGKGDNAEQDFDLMDEGIEDTVSYLLNIKNRGINDEI